MIHKFQVMINVLNHAKWVIHLMKILKFVVSFAPVFINQMKKIIIVSQIVAIQVTN